MTFKKTSELHKISTQCPTCQGKGEIDAEGYDEPIICLECNGNKLSRFCYNAVKNIGPSKSKKLRIGYLKDFARYLGLKNVQYLDTFYKVNGVADYELFEEKIGDGYLKTELQGKRKLNYTTQKTMISNIQRAYDLNKHTDIPWKFIKVEYIRQPSGVKKPEHHTYKPENVKILYDNSKLKYKAVITLLLLMRVGGVYEDKDHFLRIKDLRPAMEGWTNDEKRDFLLAVPDYSDVYKIVTYADEVNARTGEREEYSFWTTPEGYDLINQMLAERQRDGELGEELRYKPFKLENFAPDSPVFRKKSSGISHRRAKNYPKEMKRMANLLHPSPLSFSALESYFAILRIKFLGHIPKKGLIGAAASVGVKLIHGLRSSGLTLMDKAGIKESVQEWLQGADLKGRRKFYLDHPEADILAEFWKAVPLLTIDKTKYLQATIQQKDKVIHDREKEIARLDDDRYLWHVKHDISAQRIDKVENMLELIFKKFGIPLPDKPDTADKPQLTDNTRLDRIEAMISKLVPQEDQPKGEIKRISSLESKDEKGDSGNTEG